MAKEQIEEPLEQKKGRMNNTQRDRKMADARGMYLRGYSLQSISEMETIQVGVKTLAKWAKDECWEEEKQLQNISPNEIKAMILKNVAAIKSGKAMPFKPDDISKLAAAWEKMDDAKKRAVFTMEAFDGFIDFMLDRTAKSKAKKRERSLEILKEIRELQDEYLNTLL
ncbi:MULTISPECIES: terminase gpP N-terminus-related DNA-binding protein [Sphingobacterium]|uniref:terminase gpP N-terminus-related DNA-binding protein n=1 Tax=Sphingobacterium TaxID=28453 RepID=UPI00257B4E6F|nr:MULTISPECIES: hypothetical protein [Sphingobacterium]